MNSMNPFIDAECRGRSCCGSKCRSFWFVAAILAIFVSCSNSWGQSITVNPLDTRQFISMMGGDMERSGRNFHQAGNQQDVIDWCVKDIPFNTWRVGYDKVQEMTEGNKDFSVYNSDVLAMQMMRSVNPDIQFFATMESDYNGFSQGNRSNLPTFIYDYAYVNGAATGSRSFNATKYGIFLADYVEYMEQQNVPITFLSISKEWVQVLNPNRSKATIETLLTELNSRGVAVPQIIDACTWSLTQGINTVNSYNANDALQYIYGFSTHDYWSGETKTWGDFVTAANNASRFAYADETGHGGGGFIPLNSEVPIQRTIGSYLSKCDYYEQGIEGECIFEIWPRGFGEINNNGFYAKPIFFNNGSTAFRMRSYFVMKEFATHAVDSHYVTSSHSSMPNVDTMVFRKDNQMALWVINDEESSQNNVSISLNGALFDGSVSQTVWTETTNVAGSRSNVSTNGNQFTRSITAKSLNCFVFYLDPNTVEVNLSNLDASNSFESDLGTPTLPSNTPVGTPTTTFSYKVSGLDIVKDGTANDEVTFSFDVAASNGGNVDLLNSFSIGVDGANDPADDEIDPGESLTFDNLSATAVFGDPTSRALSVIAAQFTGFTGRFVGGDANEMITTSTGNTFTHLGANGQNTFDGGGAAAEAIWDTPTGDFTASGGDNGSNGFGIDELSARFVLTTVPTGLVGDINCDGEIDFLDISPFILLLTSGGFDSKADINGDGLVDFLDISPLIGLLTSQ